MTPIDWIFGSLLLAAVIGLAKSHFSNIRLENDKQRLTEQIGDLSGKIADLTQDSIQAIKTLTNERESEIKKKDDEIKSLHGELELFRAQASKDRVDRKAEDMLFEVAKRKEGWTQDSLFQYFFGHAVSQGEFFFAQLVRAGHVEKIGVDAKGVDLWGATDKGRQLAFSRHR
jgi:hypothetical protein